MTWRGLVVAAAMAAGAAGCAQRDAGTTERAPAQPAQQPPPGAPAPERATGVAPSPAPAQAPEGPAAEMPRSTKTEADSMDLATASAALARAERELGDTMQLAAPDCDRARLLRDRICELSARICRIADTDPESATRCVDSQERCSRAGTRVAGPCG